MADNTLVGDPIEKLAFEGIGFKHDGRRTSSAQGGIVKLMQIKRFLFESSIKRMATIVNVEEKATSGDSYKVLAKGAPEVMRKLLQTVPPSYDATFTAHVKSGARVLALAYKNLPRAPSETYVTMKREEAECDLIFCGFIIAECPLKPATKRVIAELK